MRLKGNKRIPDNLVAEPAGCHAWSNLEQIWNDSLIQASEPFLGYNHLESVKYALVLVAHSGHCVDLESSTQNVADTG